MSNARMKPLNATALSTTCRVRVLPTSITYCTPYPAVIFVVSTVKSGDVRSLIPYVAPRLSFDGVMIVVVPATLAI